MPVRMACFNADLRSHKDVIPVILLMEKINTGNDY